MGFEFKEYIGLIKDMKFGEADNYRCTNLPKVLFKYIGLFDIETCKKDPIVGCDKSLEKNNQKFLALENNQLWMPSFNYLNDPFEFKALYLNRQPLEERGWPLEDLEKLLDEIKKLYLLSCFSTNLTDSMPMWAHYANNHKGFCIEYEIINPKFLYPVSYESERIPIASSITQLIKKFEDLANKRISDDDPELRLYFTIIYHASIIKHKSWAYENEYRLIFPNQNKQKYGDLVSLPDLGLEATKIYIGADCSTENEEKLLPIAAKINCNVHKMHLYKYNPMFELCSKQL